MDIQKGAVMTGKVTGITKFGAFVQLAPGKSGLVYISEIANTFVSNVADFVSVGQEVQVKVLSIDEQGRINLSIKQAQPRPEPRPKPPRPAAPRPAPSRPAGPFTPDPYAAVPPAGPVDAAFEDKLKRFMKDSEGKLSDAMRKSERCSNRRRR